MADKLPRYRHLISVAEELVSSWGTLLLGQMHGPATTGRIPVVEELVSSLGTFLLGQMNCPATG